MIRLPTSIYVATSPVDLRCSFDRLAGIVREQLGGDPAAGALFVFHNRTRTHAKMLWRERTGYRILYTRLDRGTYRIPLALRADDRSVVISLRELLEWLDGIDFVVVREARRGTPRIS